ncbi:hypothetical protein ORI20_27680 [Mycobacterium sp. CVI_P3]|uniref:Uncharacterized protein n=1 Tax=Mycobacterium pinniadriaticum TaxID=2994102 RepID=A0ABT3SNM3_9MYCO|nr:hypothetical protein [Mycobacterium pinniadriaticum]MCX2934053.1 hypothetical protein [Mycobacterium pinniadriaticum]MCX2940450.1 hypothetical protein [Mycobacterium pinniadriaticum]
MSDSDRSAVLNAAVAYEVTTYRCRVESQTPFQAVLVYGNDPNHVVWALLSIFTCGLLVIGWIIAAATQRETRRTLSVDPYGQVIRL